MTSQPSSALIGSPRSGQAHQTAACFSEQKASKLTELKKLSRLVLNISLMLWLALHAMPSLAAVISVTPDRNPVRLDESFNLIFSADESPDDDPDFHPLDQDFDIVSQSQSSQVSVINGHFSKTTQWTLTVTARRAGTLTIPAIAFGSDHSQPATVIVEAAGSSASDGADAELFLEAEAAPRSPYVQAQAIYTVRVFHRVNISGADLTEPAAPDALIERLGDDRRYVAERNGLQYAVIERKYAIFPQKSGTLTLEPLTLKAQIIDGGRSRFNSFFDRPTRVARARSDAVQLNVRPIPAPFVGKHWLPAESLELEESWSQTPPQAIAGEPVTQTLTLRARGATVGVLPELSGIQQLLGSSEIKSYPDQPVMNEEKLFAGVLSTRQEKTALIPARAGTYKLPAITIEWWNTKTDRLEVARVPERVLTVLPSSEPATQTAPPPALPLPQVVNPQSPAPLSQTGTRVSTAAGSDVWSWLALLFLAGWLGTATAWWLSSRQRQSAPKMEPRPNAGERAARKALQQACLDDDAMKARQALLEWAQIRWSHAELGNLGELSRLAGNPLAVEIERLNRSLYGRGEHAWRGGALWLAVEAMESEPEGKESVSAIHLEPLYKL